MNEKYIRFFKNETQIIHELGYAAIIIIAAVLTCLVLESTVALIPISIMLGLIMRACESLKSNAAFDADDTQVKFSYFGRNTVISYDNIEKLSIERRSNVRSVKGYTDRFYVETLTITTAEREYSFSAKMDIDYNKIAMDPAYLNEQFENSQFSRLRRYIADNLNSNIMYPQGKLCIEDK
jgi:hypothetical protein